MRARPLRSDPVADLAADSPQTVPRPLARPLILGGAAMPAVVRPKDFDLTIHRQLSVSAAVTPITRAELASRIQALKNKKHPLG